jgi:hypothetical protein
VVYAGAYRCPRDELPLLYPLCSEQTGSNRFARGRCGQGYTAGTGRAGGCTENGRPSEHLLVDCAAGRDCVPAGRRGAGSSTLSGEPLLGVISDAQHSERLAVAQLWPEIPHQTCHFQYFREVSQPIYDVDRSMRTAMRKTIGNRLKKTRNQMAHQQRKEQEQADLVRPGEQEQLQVLADYADGGSSPPSI